MSVPHPIPYQGSKRHLANRILARFPAQTTRLIEPFAGSAALSLAALYNGQVKEVVLGDWDSGLIALWQAMIHAPQQLATEYQQHWQRQQGQERSYYNQVRAAFNQHQHAADLLYLLARCVKAAVRYNAQGEFNQSADHRRQGTRPATMQKHILAASHLLQGKSTLRHTDYRDLVASLTLHPTDLIYLDPPYQGVCQKGDPRYRSAVLYDEFVEFLQFLNRKGLHYIVSYDGRTGTKVHGQALPPKLELTHIELYAGRSSQATLLGQNAATVESLYLSPTLAEQSTEVAPMQLALGL